MPLNKLENFIKNYEGRILYVNSNDLDATDSISNQGNSLTKPFKTIQRAVLESARFSFVAGEKAEDAVPAAAYKYADAMLRAREGKQK
jgi:hypothetical protein